MRRILFVCMGNICRSPTVHGVFRHRVRVAGLESAFEIGSAGTHGYHAGSPPDPRSRQAAERRGFDISDLRARSVDPGDYAFYDLILAMDDENLEVLRAGAPDEHREKIHLFLEYATGEEGRSVPDPYYGGPIGFERVLDIVEEAVDALLQRLEKERPGPP